MYKRDVMEEISCIVKDAQHVADMKNIYFDSEKVMDCFISQYHNNHFERYDPDSVNVKLDYLYCCMNDLLESMTKFYNLHKK